MIDAIIMNQTITLVISDGRCPRWIPIKCWSLETIAFPGNQGFCYWPSCRDSHLRYSSFSYLPSLQILHRSSHPQEGPTDRGFHLHFEAILQTLIISPSSTRSSYFILFWERWIRHTGGFVSWNGSIPSFIKEINHSWRTFGFHGLMHLEDLRYLKITFASALPLY